MAPRAKVDKNKEAEILEAANFDDQGELDFDLGDLDLDDLGSLEAEITEQDLLDAAAEMGDSVELDMPSPETNISDAALNMLQKEVRDTQVMVARFGTELNAGVEVLVINQSDLASRMEALNSNLMTLAMNVDKLTHEFNLMNAKIFAPSTVVDPPKEEEKPFEGGLDEEKKSKLKVWMRAQQTLPSAAKVSEALAGKLGVTPEDMMNFFRAEGLVGKGGSLKKPS